MPREIARAIQWIFTDIDDTITHDGRVPAEAFSALWRAHHAGIQVVLVTGRPAGWCDHLARMWPVRAVIGENGALAFWLENSQIMRLYADRPVDAAERLEAIRRDILREVPGAKVASDQAYREYDLAIDFCEEVPRLSDIQVERIRELFEAHGATAKVSSIHVNGFFGDFNKLTMCQRWAQKVTGQAIDRDHTTYLGDSPNDAPMFEFFPHACGVQNVNDFQGRMSHWPRYLCNGRGGAGFSELVDYLLAPR